MQRTLYKDPHNKAKTWEVTKLQGGYYLRQLINGKQWSKGRRATKTWLSHLGILDYEIIETIEDTCRRSKQA